MPDGFKCVEEVESQVGHWSMMNDLGALRKALRKILEVEKKKKREETKEGDGPGGTGAVEEGSDKMSESDEEMGMALGNSNSNSNETIDAGGDDDVSNAVE